MHGRAQADISWESNYIDASRMSLIFKICSRAEWQQAERARRFDGSEADRRDGYIHFSTADQVVVTAAKHFSGQTDLVLVSIDSARLGSSLKWEPSRGGALFPHLYGHLDLNAVIGVAPLPLRDGRHVFPPLDG